ncbi:hypothetical protein M0D21_19610 [Aquimarina sp. D1M17]|uniref:HD domain-containing protein n=1 Tax=Aquimarina acroporae TaxID=2937283 RepID=UPI0020BF013F|nr:hypothetical protein [Aquimarina acroporae]MCK8523798.1 hypothetical protein [Aquimarina acroporae]
MLKDIFIALVSNYTNDQVHSTALWKAVEKHHSTKKRYYHNLTHLDHIYQNLIPIKDQTKDWDIMLFALFYHDFVYNILKQNNEEQSAVKARKVLIELNLDESRIAHCRKMIVATKGHQVSENNDINLFTDADLAILGSDWNSYETYYKNIRKEYKYYPSKLYNPGRLKMLHHFLHMPRIFKTEHFFMQYEENAKSNLQQEINILSK